MGKRTGDFMSVYVCTYVTRTFDFKAFWNPSRRNLDPCLYRRFYGIYSIYWNFSLVCYCPMSFIWFWNRCFVGSDRSVSHYSAD